MHPDALAARLACILLGYLFGSFLTAEVVARVVSGKSARQLGTGNPGMAKGGSGDVLSGIAAGLWGQKHLRSGDSDLWSLAAQAVAIHAACGDLCARELGEYAMTPGDMVRALPKVFKALEPCSGT